MSELERVKTALELTRDHNRKLAAENERLRQNVPPDPGGVIENMRLREQVASLQEEVARLQRHLLEVRAGEPIAVKVHADLLPPPPPAKKARRQERRVRNYSYSGERPLRTLWPLEE